MNITNTEIKVLKGPLRGPLRGSKGVKEGNKGSKIIKIWNGLFRKPGNGLFWYLVFSCRIRNGTDEGEGIPRNPKGPLRATKEIREGPKCLSIPQLVNLPIH